MELAGAALGLGSGPAGFEVGLLDQQQLDLLEEASSALPDNEFTLRALVTARLSVATTTIESEERRLKLAHEALSLAQAANDESAQAYSLAALCDALAGPEHCQVRANYASDIIERARRLRNWPLELLGRRLRLVALLELGNRAAAQGMVAVLQRSPRREATANRPARATPGRWRATRTHAA